MPAWVVNEIEAVQDLWAPDIVYYNGMYYLLYAASTFGSNRSANGLASNVTIDFDSPDYAWIDRGAVISSQKSDNYNALDPSPTFDKDGQPWLVFGSFWSGIKIIKLDPTTLKPLPDKKMVSLASRPSPDAIEGAYITRSGDFYYLFVSHDFAAGE